jgi:hypothetical protein
MKKTIILAIAALLVVSSGVAAVSAFEAHAVNVKAHVENALTVEPRALDFGVMFPQEWRKDKITISLSESADTEVAAGNVLAVNYEIFAEDKVLDPAVPTYYPWIGEWLWVGIDAPQITDPMDGMMYVGPATAIPLHAQPIGAGLTGSLNSGNISDLLEVAFLAPAFMPYYNALTDIKPDWWPTEWAPIPENDPRNIPAGVDLGLDLKVQVTGIVRP